MVVVLNIFINKEIIYKIKFYFANWENSNFVVCFSG